MTLNRVPCDNTVIKQSAIAGIHPWGLPDRMTGVHSLMCLLMQWRDGMIEACSKRHD